MTPEAIEQKVIEVLAEVLAIEPNEVSLDGDLRADFDASSLDLVQLIWTLEDELKEQIPEAVLEELHSANDIVQYIVNKRS